MAFPSTFMASGTVPQIRDTKRILWLKKLATIQGSQLAPFTNNNPAFSDTTWRLKAKAASAAMGRDIAETICCGSSPVVNDPVFDNLTHYWSMDEASGTRADSKGSINLSESGGAISSGAGIDSLAASWNGTGTANLTTASLGFGSSDIKSVAFWVKVNAFPASFYNFCIGEADPDPSLEIDSHDGGTTGVWVVATIVDGALDEVPAVAGTWNLFVATFVDATTWKWSMNGGAFRTVGGQSSGLPSGTTLSVAGIVNGANQMNGLIGELMTFNVLLTQGDVTTLWNGGIGKFYRP